MVKPLHCTFDLHRHIVPSIKRLHFILDRSVTFHPRPKRFQFTLDQNRYTPTSIKTVTFSTSIETVSLQPRSKPFNPKISFKTVARSFTLEKPLPLIHLLFLFVPARNLSPPFTQSTIGSSAFNWNAHNQTTREPWRTSPPYPSPR